MQEKRPESNKLYLVLPVYNEGESIYRLLQRVDKLKLVSDHECHVLIVDDCSLDDTPQWIEKGIEAGDNFTSQVIRHQQNQGLSGALNTALDNLRNLGSNDIVVTMDGDDTHPVPLITEMISKIDQGADIVIASRYCEQSRVAGLSFQRKLLSRGARYLYGIRWRIAGVRDYTCLFRACRGSVMATFIDATESPRLNEKGFTSSTELLLKLSKVAMVIVEVPLILRYERKLNTSNMRIWKTVLQTLIMILRRDGK